MRFFHFHFLTLAIIVTDTAFVGLGKKERAWSIAFQLKWDCYETLGTIQVYILPQVWK